MPSLWKFSVRRLRINFALLEAQIFYNNIDFPRKPSMMVRGVNKMLYLLGPFDLVFL